MSNNTSPRPAHASHRPFLSEQNDDVVRNKSPDFTHIRLRLYISHFLSTWNSRMFEFAAFLFLAAVFPGTLLYASIYALARSFAVFLLSSSIGKMMDSSDRLVTIRHSIGERCLHCSHSLESVRLLCCLGADRSAVWQRLPVAASCAIFASLSSLPRLGNHSHVLFIALTALACVEKLAATANTVAVERDWVSHMSAWPYVPNRKHESELPGCHCLRGRRRTKTR